MQHVTAYYLDARDGHPSTEAPLRHGPVPPSDNLSIDAVDRRQSPPLIIGRVPDDEPMAPGMTAISEAEHAELLESYRAWRQELADAEHQRIKDAIPAYRYEVETGGITLPDGTRVRTDRESQSQLANAYQSLSQPFVDEVDWKGPEGWITVTEAELEPIARAVARHVQACFTAERRVSERLEAGERVDPHQDFDTELAAILAD